MDFKLLLDTADGMPDSLDAAFELGYKHGYRMALIEARLDAAEKDLQAFGFKREDLNSDLGKPEM